jgi:hypothetical protein
MRRTIMLIAITATFSFAVSGCHGHQAKTADLQKQYDQLAKKFQLDCAAEYNNVPPKITPKCKDEEAKMNEAWHRLETERAQK